MEYRLVIEQQSRIKKQFAAALFAALVIIPSLLAQTPHMPLTKTEVDKLLQTEKDDSRIVATLKERGIDFRPADLYLKDLEAKGAKAEVLDALRAAAPKALSKDELRGLLKSGTADKAAAETVDRRGLDFWPSDDDLDELRALGAGESLYKALLKARAQTPRPDYDPTKNMTPPEPTYQPRPSYTPEARNAKFSGVAVLKITIDTEGNVTEAVVIRHVGYGLDEKAVEAVKAWKFKPATRDGTPVAIRVTVEVNFVYGQEPPPDNP